MYNTKALCPICKKRKIAATLATCRTCYRSKAGPDYIEPDDPDCDFNLERWSKVEELSLKASLGLPLFEEVPFERLMKAC